MKKLLSVLSVLMIFTTSSAHALGFIGDGYDRHNPLSKQQKNHYKRIVNVIVDANEGAIPLFELGEAGISKLRSEFYRDLIKVKAKRKSLTSEKNNAELKKIFIKALVRVSKDIIKPQLGDLKRMERLEVGNFKRHFKETVGELKVELKNSIRASKEWFKRAYDTGWRIHKSVLEEKINRAVNNFDNRVRDLKEELVNDIENALQPLRTRVEVLNSLIGKNALRNDVVYLTYLEAIDIVQENFYANDYKY